MSLEGGGGAEREITKYLFLATTYNGWGVKRSYSNVLRRLLLIFLQPGVFRLIIKVETTYKFHTVTKKKRIYNLKNYLSKIIGFSSTLLIKKLSLNHRKNFLNIFSIKINFTIPQNNTASKSAAVFFYILFENVLLVILNDLYRTLDYCLLKIIKSYCTVHTFFYYSNFML